MPEHVGEEAMMPQAQELQSFRHIGQTYKQHAEKGWQRAREPIPVCEDRGMQSGEGAHTE